MKAPSAPGGASLSESQILALVTYIREQEAEARLGSARPHGPAPGDVVRSERHSFRVELVADGPLLLRPRPERRLHDADRARARPRGEMGRRGGPLQGFRDLYWDDNSHFGSRFLFDKDGHLFYSIGDRGHMKDAQDLSRPNGKIHRIMDDGRIPKDNPFAGRIGALGSIRSYGNRNPQGLAFHPVTGDLFETEHGPRGGDELNRIEPAKNYGWPVITYGIDYDGTPITDKTTMPGMEQPATQWTPSLAACGIAFYTGDKFPNWKNGLS